MKKTMIAAALLAATLNTPNVYAEGEELKHLILAPDISGSSSILTNDHFAKAAIMRVRQKIMSQSKGTWIEIKTFGDGGFEHVGNRKIRISSKGATTSHVANLVETTLNDIRAKAGQGQSSTNMLAFLELEELHCDTGAAEIWFISDAIEHNIDISGTGLLNGTETLPKPDEGLLTGCKVTIIGLGNVSTGLLPRAQRKTLEKAWRAWFTAAGVDDLDIIYRP